MPVDLALVPREELRTKIVEAAAALLHEQGASSVTTRGVADAAGVQPPTIYRLFGDKDGLLDAVAELAMARHVAAKQERDDDDPLTSLRSGWQAQIGFGLSNPDLFRLLNARDRISPAIEAGIAVLRLRIHRLASAGLLVVSEQRALDLIHAAGTGAVQALLEAPPAERDLGMADVLLDSVLATITRQHEPRSEAPTTISVANALAASVHELPGLSDAERSLLTEWLERSIRFAQRSTGTNPTSGDVR